MLICRLWYATTPYWANAAVGGDQGQIDAQRVVQRNDILLQEDLDELHQHCNDQDEHDGLQVAQVSRVQNEDLDGGR